MRRLAWNFPSGEISDLPRCAGWSSSITRVINATLSLALTFYFVYLYCVALAFRLPFTWLSWPTLSDTIFFLNRVPATETVKKRKKKGEKVKARKAQLRPCKRCTLTPRTLFSSHCEKEAGRVQPSTSLRLIAPRTLGPTATLAKKKSFRPSDIDEGLIKEGSVLEGVPWPAAGISRNYTPS